MLVVTVNYPETSTIFIDRFLASAEAYRIPVKLVFNKIDAYNEDELRYLDALINLYTHIGYPCFKVSAKNGNGVNEIKKALESKITLFSGHSGVGKSTLINAILPGTETKTGEISSYHNKGMHTTTFSEMFPVNGDGYIIDTPGIKGFGTFDMEEEEIALRVTINTPTETAEDYMKDLSVTASSQTTTIAKISVNNTVKERGVDFVNRLVAFYNQDANDEKNEVAQKTAEFIEERIGIINHELGTAESELADFKQRSGLTDLTSDARLALQESSKYEQQRTENATQISLVQFLRTYINDPVNKEEVIPANVGYRIKTSLG